MLILLACLFGLSHAADYDRPPPPKSARVIKVYDGDTVTLENGDKVRLRWVNTPEKRPYEPFATEARDLAARLVLNQRVELLLDGPNPRDGYGRIIAGLHNGRYNLSIKLLEAGLAHVFVIPPEPEDMTPFLKAQAEAKARHKGIWSTDRYKGALHITSFHADARGKDDRNVNGEYMRVANIAQEAVHLDGYTLTTLDGRSFDLPKLTIPAGHTVMIHSGMGIHQHDPAQQLSIYLGSPRPIWDNLHDRATIKDPAGQVVDEVLHKVKPH